MGASQSRSTRRDFLAGKSAVQAAQDLLPAETDQTANVPPAPGAINDSYLIQIGRTAMACDFEVFLNAGQKIDATERAIEALDLVEALESQMSIYRPTSEVLEINRRAFTEPVTVERRLFALLQRAVELHSATGGAFDITSSPLSRIWGFLRREGRMPTPEEIATVRESVGTQWLELDEQSATIRFCRPGIEINLNAIGKGYALDRSAELLAAGGVGNFLIHGGKSSVRAGGSRATTDSQGRGWLVSVKHPYKPSQTLVELWLQNAALGTSGSANQYFHFQGKRYGHLIDPRTGWPVDGMLSATVLAPNAADADALATALFVMGVDEAIRFCGTRPELGCICISNTRRSGEIQLHICGINRDDWRLVMDPESPDIAVEYHERSNSRKDEIS